MKKENLIVIVIMCFILFVNISVSALICERLNSNNGDGLWCQPAEEISECDSNYRYFEAETKNDVPECNIVCANEGICSENMNENQCVEEGGRVYETSLEEVAECQKVCCTYGENAEFMTPTECRQLAIDENIQTNIREEIKDYDSCKAIETSYKKGACVIKTELESVCSITTESGCTGEEGYGGLLEKLELPYANSELKPVFHEGFLCTAYRGGSPISDCAPSKNTICEENKVYYIDNCGNLANIYDSSKPVDDQTDYWTYIYNPSDETEVCQIDSVSSTCGNCDSISSSTSCQVGNAARGNYICGDLSCTDESIPEIKDFNKIYGRYPKHGESWCGGAESALFPEKKGDVGIKINNDGELNEKSRNLLENEDEYNLPGSRYYKYICEAGEVTVEECSDYRNEICAEIENEGEAACVFNPWRTCFQLGTKSDCEDPSILCKWVSGYRWDLDVVNEKSEHLREEEQGSCVPLIAPGFDFWEADTSGAGVCATGMIQDYALYETTWWISRENFAGWGSKTQSHACLNGCYSIPEYGSDFVDSEKDNLKCEKDSNCGTHEVCFNGYCVNNELYKFYDESEYALPGNVENYHLSDRRGAYCHKDGNEDKWLTGQVSGSAYDCTPGAGSEAKDERKERDFPLFLTQKSWLDSITSRARSLGDCGFKDSFFGEAGDPSTEIVTALFEKLKQNQEVKSLIQSEQIIYKGKDWVGDETEPYDLDMYERTYYSCAEQGGFCGVGEENCIDGIVEGDGSTELCPSGQICCVYNVE